MIDFSTEYLGLKLGGPIVVSSTPLSESLDNIRRMEDAGASAVVLISLLKSNWNWNRAHWTRISRGALSLLQSRSVIFLTCATTT